MKTLSLKEFTKIVDIINKKHSLITGKAIKYLDSTFDFRTLSFFRINLRGFGKEKEFTVVNRIEEPKFNTLYEEIIDWLDSVEN
jgi:hypothetical protein